ncbi:MAG: glycosyl transferase family 2 [Phycisphaerae bacterium]|nr:glycosyl transferase family 2 [Phycisphaerae bacterium]
MTTQIANRKSEIANSLDAIVLAAGQGTRMGGGKAKVLYEAAGRPLVCWVVDACFEAGVNRCVVVVGYQADAVRAAMAGLPRCTFVEQHERLGTGHAVMMARPSFDDAPTNDVLVLAGDAPLVQARTLTSLIEEHHATGAAATVATAVLDDPTGYGRVLRDSDGSFVRIVEHKDATPEQLAVREINPSYYCFQSDKLFTALTRIRNDNAQNEYYLTDVPEVLKASGDRVSVVGAVPAEQVMGVNTTEQLKQVEHVLRTRTTMTNVNGERLEESA